MLRFGVFIFLLLAAGPAWAADVCAPKLWTSVKATTDAEGRLLVPVAIDGKSVPLVLSTGSAWSSVTDALADRVGLRKREGRVRFRDANGNRYKRVVYANSVTLGAVSFDADEQFLVDSGVPGEGEFGMNYLRYFDFEINNGSKTLSLFEHSKCGPPSARWSVGPVAEIPFRMKDEVLLATVHIGGRPISASLSSDQAETRMSLKIANTQFGITPETRELTHLGTARFANGTETFETYRLVLPELYISGVRFENVPVKLLDVDDFGFELGMNELKHLRLYFAFENKMIYATLADHH